MKFPPKHWRRWLVGILIMLLITPALIIRHAVNEITQPPRRSLQDYHRTILDDPKGHSIHIQHFTTSDATPVLICTPTGKPLPKSRGEILRSQLLASGQSLANPGEIIGTLVLIHGRRGRKEDLLPMAERFCAIGFRCLIPDLPAHGDHPETLATYGFREAPLPALVLREAAAAHHFPTTPAALLGMSMGGSVAIHSAARSDSPWASMIILQSFDQLAPIISAQSRNRLGTTCGTLAFRSIAAGFQSRTGHPLHAIQPAKHLESCAIPTLIAHGTNDQTIPLSSGKKLFSHLPTTLPKRWIEVPDATHENLLITNFPLYAALSQWLLQHTKK